MGAVGVAGGAELGGAEEVLGGDVAEGGATEGDESGDLRFAGKLSGDEGEVVELGEVGFALDGADDAFESLCGVAEEDLAAAVFGVDEGAGGAEGLGASVGLAGLCVVGALKVGVAEGFVEHGAVGSEGFGVGEGDEGLVAAIEADQAKSGEEPGIGVARIQLGGLGEERESGCGVAAMGELDPAKFDVGSDVGGIREQVLAADLAVEIVLAVARLVGVLDLAEVVDDKGGELMGEAEGADAFGDILVDGPGEADAGMAAEEAGAAAAHVGGVGTGGLDEEGVGERGLVARPGVGGADVVPAVEIVGEDVGLRVSPIDGLGEEGLGGDVEHLVGVEDEDPVAAAVLENTVAGVGEVVLPGDGEDFGAEGAGDGDGVVGAAGVAEYDAVNEAGDTFQAADEAGGAVFHDHGEFNARGRH